jgi:hypothetical protein
MNIFSATLLITIVFSSLDCSGSRERKLKESGAAVIAKIENFRTENSKLPDTLSDVEVQDSEEGPFYYRKTGESSYEVWFGADLGESVTYDSKSHKWNR